ncbi:VanZ family protein [Lutibacter sp. A64]|uniref:VanZ family protein n=1 Tax=Lutibacter sp. A64 TaxID=2918526 RepID=UPI001F060300|nr:VanZ family protein [Lutibacter sp. A64]UMB52661.1 VanZ family protein [Lutibacter sp. A64]
MHKIVLFFAISLTIIIGWGSLITIGDTVPSNIKVSDKLIHSSAYFLLTLCWLIALNKNYKYLNINTYIIFLIFFYGIIIEVLQKTVTANRQFEIKDILANLLGIAIGFTVFKVFQQKKLLK